MKKLLAVLMAAMMLFSFACGEESSTVTVDFDDTCALEIVCPEGYLMDLDVQNGIVIIKLVPVDETLATYTTAIIPTDDPAYSAITRLNDLTEEQLAAYIASCTEGWNAPRTEIVETGMGSKALIVDETGVEGDYAQLYSVYNGFQITTYISHESDGSEVTQEDKDALLKFHTEMNFIIKDEYDVSLGNWEAVDDSGEVKYKFFVLAGWQKEEGDLTHAGENVTAMWTKGEDEAFSTLKCQVYAADAISGVNTLEDMLSYYGTLGWYGFLAENTEIPMIIYYDDETTFFAMTCLTGQGWLDIKVENITDENEADDAVLMLESLTAAE